MRRDEAYEHYSAAWWHYGGASIGNSAATYHEKAAYNAARALNWVRQIVVLAHIVLYAPVSERD